MEIIFQKVAYSKAEVGKHSKPLFICDKYIRGK